MRSFFNNPEAQFTSPEQASAINAVLNTKKDLLVVLPTGAGKTLVFLLPIFIMKKHVKRNMMTIVIVPLVALAMDLKKRCEMSNITYTTWKGI